MTVLKRKFNDICIFVYICIFCIWYWYDYKIYFIIVAQVILTYLTVYLTYLVGLFFKFFLWRSHHWIIMSAIRCISGVLIHLIVSLVLISFHFVAYFQWVQFPWLRSSVSFAHYVGMRVFARNIWKTSSSPKGAAAAPKYAAPEYYQHDRWSFYELESKLTKFRLPQPSSRTPPAKPAQPTAGQKPAAQKWPFA